jgi:hypothetical protein
MKEEMEKCKLPSFNELVGIYYAGVQNNYDKRGLKELKELIKKICPADHETLRYFSKNTIVEKLRDKRKKIEFDELDRFNKYLDIYSW